MMKMAEVRYVGGYPVIAFKGKITLGPDCVKLRQKTDELFSRNENLILLDLSDVEYVDSTGLGALAGIYVKATLAGGNLALCNVQARVRALLELTKLDDKIPSFPDLESAAAALTPTVQ